MMSYDFIIDVTEADFEYQVLAYSQQVPVVVDFWAPWCVPCRVLGPMLERFAQEGQGTFRLAKVNVDDNPKLASLYQLRSIPAVKAFRDGKLASEFVGAQPEPRIREFLRALVPSQLDLMVEKGFSQLQLQEIKPAEITFKKVLDSATENAAALLGLSRALLLQGSAAESLEILINFPPSREYSSAEKLLPLARALSHLGEEIFSDDPLDAAYQNALRLIIHANLEAAMDGLLDILRQDKHYRNDDTRKLILSIFELIGEDNPTTRQYRGELATVLF